MKHPAIPLFALLALAAAGGCERKSVTIELPPPTPLAEPVAKTRTLETSRLGAAVDAYARERSGENRAAVKKAIAELDGEIAELEALVSKRTGQERDEAAAKLRNLTEYRTAETARFATVEAGAPVAVPDAREARSGADKIEDTAKRVGNTVEDAARKTGDAIKDAVR